MRWFMKRAGAGVPSANRITLLRDTDGDGVADTRTVVSARTQLAVRDGAGRQRPLCRRAPTRSFGFPMSRVRPRIAGPGEKVVDLPAGTINHHWTKNVIANRDGSRLYVTVGSNSNVAENGMENEVSRAAILEVDPATRRSRIFASGLRNPNGLGFDPRTGALWTVVNERDELGSDLVPDYLTSVRDGGFYGWPYSYYGPHVDTRVKPPRPDLVASAIAPDYALGSHVAPLGMTFYDEGLLGRQIRGRRIHRRARLVESPAAQRLQSGVRPVRRRTADRIAGRRAHRIRRCRRRCSRTTGGRRDRSRRRAPRRRRRRQCHLASDRRSDVSSTTNRGTALSSK